MLGTQANPLPSASHSRVADALLNSVFTTPSGWRGLWEFQGKLYYWKDGNWTVRNHQWLRRFCWQVLADTFVATFDGAGAMKSVPYGPSSMKVANVLEALDSKIQLGHERLPAFLSHDPGWDPSYCISLRDTVINTVLPHDGSPMLIPREEYWLDPVVLPFTWDEVKTSAEPKRWFQAINEWGGGDPAWAELLQRLFGYALLPHARYAKWFLFQGKVRSGKGTITKVLEMLLGLDAFVGTSLFSLGSRFGLEGVQGARVICVNEVAELDRQEGARCAQVLKCILGEDRVDIEPKGRPIVRNVRMCAVPIIVSNMIPRLPNEGRGLSSKMIVLPFDHSFLGREDVHLIDKLRSELAGITKWALAGAIKLVSHNGSFTMPEAAAEHVQLYLNQNNPLDCFLRARFVEDPESFVANELLWSQWLDWCRKNHVRKRIARNQLPFKIEQESSWTVKRHRFHGSKRGLLGLGLRKVADDEG
jgi:P4 family phage/plasmid primase-like protien